LLLKKELPFLRKTYSVKRLSLFGSTVRGESKVKSDVDVLVEFRSPIGLIKFMELENHLSAPLGKRVDLVMHHLYLKAKKLGFTLVKDENLPPTPTVIPA
jgi:uncharacterized protein